MWKCPLAMLAVCLAGWGTLGATEPTPAPAQQPSATQRADSVIGSSFPQVPVLSEPGPSTWGLIVFRGFVTGVQAAPNGVTFKPLFSLDFNLNLWLCKEQGVYGFTDKRPRFVKEVNWLAP